MLKDESRKKNFNYQKDPKQKIVIKRMKKNKRKNFVF